MSITLEPKLQSKLDQVARRLGKSAEEVADAAIRAHLTELDAELDARVLADEEQAYQRLYPELRERYWQQYVAIQAGRVIDAAPDFEAVYLRVRQQYGDRTVLIRRVGDTPVEEYRVAIELDRQPHVDRLFDTLDRLAAVEPPLTPEEIEAEIKASRRTPA